MAGLLCAKRSAWRCLHAKNWARIPVILRENHGSNYVCICSDEYRVRGNDCQHAVQRLFRPLARRVAIRNWNSRVLHGIPLGASFTRR